jgi:cell wall-associated NlpC family hydrolase
MTHVLTRIATLAALVVACALLATQASAEPRHRSPAAAPKHHTLAEARKEQRHPKRRIRRARPTLGERAARIAKRYLCVPCSYGGASPGGFDCSGLVMYVYSRLGVSLPHHAASQYAYGRAVPYARLKAGDLVFFSGLGHVGLYVGRGRFVDAPQSGEVVRVRRLAERRDSFVGARRIVAA